MFTLCTFFVTLYHKKCTTQNIVLLDIIHIEHSRQLRRAISMCFVYKIKTCKFFLPLSVITQVIHFHNGIWKHHLLSNKVGQNSCPLILDNNHSKISVICVWFRYKYFFRFSIRRRLSFLKTFLVSLNRSCLLKIFGLI